MPELRHYVFAVIGHEREYQEALWGPTEEAGRHSVTEFLTYIRDYTEEALHTVSRIQAPQCNESALHNVRKIAALAVACMERHGAPQRAIEEFGKGRLILRRLDETA